MIKIGLTGSIAVGKSYVLSIFKTEYNIPVFSSDECVKEIYRNNADLNNFIKNEILGSNIEFSNEDIANIVFADRTKLEKLENYIHPLVKIERDNFIKQERNKKSKFVVIEVPLLFEKNLDLEFDKVILIHVSEDIQEKRALSRKNMNKEKYLAIKANQIPDNEKIKRSDFIIHNHNEARTRDSVDKIVRELNKQASI
ncbi:MAG: dephospho-CoA kinase [Rhodobiaceae bacterium]|nr:dephospho-CoA kinase [Rhodobiaceae bacterium]|tara:strand:- start:8518 stop:9111 length:594 start_codon:yes stop_codon:yes gene_type:complete